MLIQCKTCGEFFEFSQGEINFYLKKGFSYPKRCKECRKQLDLNKLGMKTSTFLTSAAINGMPYPVEGGTEVVCEYIVQIKQSDKSFYLKKLDSGIKLTDDIRMAAKYSRTEAEQVKKMIEDDEDKLGQKIIATILCISHYETLRSQM